MIGLAELSASSQSRAISVFEDRLILSAQPPITEATLTEIEAVCAGPIPPELKDLWRVSFGGRIDYDLSLSLDGMDLPFSFTEIYYPESGTLLDFWDRIAEEQAARGGEDSAAPLDYLPFGGFEQHEVLYVCVKPGSDYGSVFASMDATPWTGALGLKESAAAKVTSDLRALFRKLALHTDPFAPDADPLTAGSDMVAEIEAFAQSEPQRASALRDLVRASVLDWRGALQTGEVVQNPSLQSLALEQCAAGGDLLGLQRLASLGCDLRQRLSGSGNALDHAMARGQTEAARWLMARGLDVSTALINGAGFASAEITRELLRRGAHVNVTAIAQAASKGQKDSARLMADVAFEKSLASVQEAIDTLDRWAEGKESTSARIEAGEMLSNQSAEEIARQGRDLRTIQAYCVRLLGRRRR